MRTFFLLGLVAIASVTIASVASAQERAMPTEETRQLPPQARQIEAEPAEPEQAALLLPAVQKVRSAAEAESDRNKVFAADLDAPPPVAGTLLSAGDNVQEWKCTEYSSGAVSCECKGMNDCKALLDSGKCEGKSWWEDGDDPSIGGCDGSAD